MSVYAKKKTWTAIDSQSKTPYGKLISLIKFSLREFFQAEAVSKLLYGCTIWTLTKRLKEKRYVRMLRAVPNKSWKQHLTKQQLHDHLPPISQTNQERRRRHAEHYERSKDELICVTFFSGLLHMDTPAKACIHQLCVDTECSLEDLPRAIVDRD